MNTTTDMWITTADAGALLGWLDDDRLPARLAAAGITRNADGLWSRHDIARRKNGARRRFKRAHRTVGLEIARRRRIEERQQDPEICERVQGMFDRGDFDDLLRAKGIQR